MEVSFIVKKSEPVLVHAEGKTPDDDYFLSNFDQNAWILTKTLFSFKVDERKECDNVIDVLKDALAKVLVEYYPYTGRAALDSDERFMIKCNGEGVPFVDAYVEDKIEVLGDITILCPAQMQLIHFVDGVNIDDMLEVPPLTVQITKFECGGFVIGIGMNHIMSDGAALGEFMNSWAEIARGETLAMIPFLDRTILKPRQPPKIEFPHHEFGEEYLGEDLEMNAITDLVYWSVCFHPKVLNRLKPIVRNDLSKSPTSFELIAALMWRYRTIALKVDPNEHVKLNIIVSLRNKVKGFLPKGYFGNGYVLSCCYCKAGELVKKPLSFAVKLVQEAIDSVTETYAQSYIDYIESTRNQFAVKRTCYISKVARLPLYDADFGWGYPKQVMLISLMYRECYYLSQSRDTENVVLSLPLPASAMEIFKELIQKELS